MDTVAAEGGTAGDATIEAGGLALTARATITHRITGLRTKPYRERTIERDTRTFFSRRGSLSFYRGVISMIDATLYLRYKRWSVW